MVSTDLRHPDLRWRDVRRVIGHRDRDILWDSGVDPKNEWVYATVESDAHRGRLLQWLRSKNVSRDSDAFLFVLPPSPQLVTVTWGEVLDQPERFFGGPDFELVSKDLDWRLDHKQGCVARFGRWPSASHANHLTRRCS
jgi:hypothetical protein